MKRLSLLAFALSLSAVTLADPSLSSGLIPSQLLNSSNDGWGSDVQSLLAANGAVVDLQANQSADRIFSQDGAVMTWEYVWSRAGLVGEHRLGWYGVDSPDTINWVLGNKNQDGWQTYSWTGSISGQFGLVLDNGDGSYFYSDPNRNIDTPLVSSDPELDGFDRRIHVGVFHPTNTSDIFLTWEDLVDQTEVGAGGLLDYNDYGYRFSSMAPVPEPGTMIALGAGAVAFLARRRKKAASKD